MPRSNTPEHTRANATRSRCAASMPACTLNTNAQNGVASTHRGSLAVGRVALGVGRGGASSSSISSSCPTPKFCMRRGEQHGGRRARRGTAPGRGRRRRPRAARGPRRRRATPGPRGARPLRPDPLLRGDASRRRRCGCRRRSRRWPGAGRRGSRRRCRPARSAAWAAGRSAAWISSISSSGSRPGRSHLLMMVITGMPRCLQTRNSLRVCGSSPLAASTSITAASTADSTR